MRPHIEKMERPHNIYIILRLSNGLVQNNKNQDFLNLSILYVCFIIALTNELLILVSFVFLILKMYI